MTSPPPIVWAIIGPNGAGKSTYYATRVQPHLKAEFVNADIIARRLWPGEETAHGYEAARAAQARRDALIASRRSFVMETVFSHPSKLKTLREAQRAGYSVWVSFIYLASPDLAVLRVADRVHQGGHAVPHDKVRGRYQRMAALAVQAVELAERAFVLDNSDSRRPLRDLLQLERGLLTFRAEPLPHWVRALFAQHLSD